MNTPALDKAILDQKKLLSDIVNIDVQKHPCSDILVVAKEELIESICNTIHELIRIRDTINYGK